MPIFHDTDDFWECNKLLFHLNDSYHHDNWKRDLAKMGQEPFARPKFWPPRDPLVCICAYTLHSNHFHLLIKEIEEGGLTHFMLRLPKVLTIRYNKKYGGSGSIFQGPYQSRFIESTADLRNVSLYIMGKNVMERFPEGGIDAACFDFERAWEWALNDEFSSFPEYGNNRNSPIIDADIVGELWRSSDEFKKEVKAYIQQRIN